MSCDKIYFIMNEQVKSFMIHIKKYKKEQKQTSP